VKKLCILVVFMCLPGCVHFGWQDNTRNALEAVHKTAKRAMNVTERLCEPTLQRCIDNKQNPCIDLMICQQRRDPVFRVIESLQHAVKMGLSAVEIQEQDHANQKLLKAFEILAELRVILHMWGVQL